MKVFLAEQDGPKYWFRRDRTEELRHLEMLQALEIAAKLAGVKIRPKVPVSD